VTALARTEPETLAADVVVRDDLSALNDAQLKTYYIELCASLDLNHLTRPFSFINLNGKKRFYANRDCTDQLRTKRSVSIRIVSRERMDDMIVVTARATLPNGREDESVGAVPCGANVKGENLANAMMKAETKAKRRVTLSICGLGVMDESEVDGALAANDHRGDLGNPRSMHTHPGGDPDEEPKENPDFDDIMGTLRDADKAVFDPAVTRAAVDFWRDMIGSKGKPSELGKRLSALFHSDAISAGQRQELGKAWNRVDRKLTALEAKLPKPDGTEAFSPEREIGEEG